MEERDRIEMRRLKLTYDLYLKGLKESSTQRGSSRGIMRGTGWNLACDWRERRVLCI